MNSLAKSWTNINREGLGLMLNVGTGAGTYWYVGKAHINADGQAPANEENEDSYNWEVDNSGIEPLIYEKIGFRYFYKACAKENSIYSGQSVGAYFSGIMANAIRNHKESYEVTAGLQWGLHFVNCLMITVAPSVIFGFPTEERQGNGSEEIPMFFSLNVGLEFGIWEYLSKIDK